MAPRIAAQHDGPERDTMIAAIAGAGELGAAIAVSLAVRGRVREVRLIDEAGTVAAGKALDIRQSLAVHRSATRLEGSTSRDAAAGADIVVIADSAGTRAEWAGEGGLVLVQRLQAVNPRAPLLFAGASQLWLVERTVLELGRPWSQVAGSAPLALAAALRSLLALEARTAPGSVSITVAGRPPRGFVATWDAATVDGEPARARLGARTVAELAARLPFLWPPGPGTLALAAAHFAEGLLFGSRAPLAGFAVPAAGQPAAGHGVRSGHQPAGSACSLRLARGRLVEASVPTLSPQERVALDNAIGARA
jgi:hypothetical protein